MQALHVAFFFETPTCVVTCVGIVLLSSFLIFEMLSKAFLPICLFQLKWVKISSEVTMSHIGTNILHNFETVCLSMTQISSRWSWKCTWGGKLINNSVQISSRTTAEIVLPGLVNTIWVSDPIGMHLIMIRRWLHWFIQSGRIFKRHRCRSLIFN